MNLTGLYRFGDPAKPHTFTDMVRVLRRSGFFPEDVTMADGRLDLNHTDTFSTFYHGYFNDDKTQGDDEKTKTGEVGFSKSFYESLVVGGRLISTERTFNGGTDKVVGAYFDTQYRKQTPIGLYSLGILLGRDHETERSSSGQRRVIGENTTLDGIAFVQLSQRGATPASIVVQNSLRTITYVLGLDYQVRVTGRIVEIARLIGGAIADGDTVLVDYNVDTAEFAVFNTDTFDWLNRLDLKAVPVSLYYNRRVRNQILVRGEDPGNLDKETDQLGGMELNYQGFTFVAEHEPIQRTLFPPTTATRGRVQYLRQLGGYADLSCGGTAEKLKYLNPQEFGIDPNKAHIDTVSAFARVATKLGQRTILRVEAEYMRTRGRENNMLTHVGVGLEWSYQSLDFSIEARHNIFQQEFTDGTSEALLFTLRRRF
jgi:hypothetical protein